MSIEKQYVVGSKVTLSETMISYAWKNDINVNVPHKTDIFNKKSRTTVCFNPSDSLGVMYCENCDTTHYDNMGTLVEVIGESDTVKEFKASDVVCKNCGSSYDINDIRVLQRKDNHSISDARLVYCNVYNDDDLVKLSIKSCNMLVEKAFFFVDNKYKLIFNTKNGQTLIRTSPDCLKNKVKFISSNLCLINVTYRGGVFDVPFDKCLVDTEFPEQYKIDIFKEIYTNVYEKISKNLGYKPTTLEDYAKEFNITDDKKIYNTAIIALYNRFPNLNPYIIAKLEDSLETVDNFFLVSVLNRMRKIKNTSKNPLEELMNLYHIKDKETFTELFKKGSTDVYEMIYYSTLFKNPKYIKELISIKRNDKIVNSSSQVNDLLRRDYTPFTSRTMLFKQIARKHGEEYLCEVLKTHVTSGFSHSFINSLSYYYMYFKQNIPKFTMNLKEIIDEEKRVFSLTKGNDEIFMSMFMPDKEVESNIYDFRETLVNNLNEYLYNSNKDKFKFNIKSVKEYYEEFTSKIAESPKDTYKNLTHLNVNASYLYKYAPTFNPFILANMFEFCGYRNGDIQSIERMPEVILNLNPLSTDVLGDVFRYYGIPNVKSLRNKILSKPRLFVTLVFFAQLFKDVNILNSILDKNCIIHVELLLTDNSFENLERNKFYKFIKMMIEKQGESIVGRKIVDDCNNRFNYIIDCARMYSSYQHLYGTQELEVVGSIKEIHDRLIRLTGGTYNTLTKADFKPYKYTDKEKELVFDYNGYSFELAKTGKQLVEIGHELKNCVGSYAKTVRKKGCIIVPVYYNGQYKICIELKQRINPEVYYELHQAKLYANTPVYKEREAYEAVLKWMEVKGIKGDSRDLDCIEDFMQINRNNQLDNNMEDVHFFDNELEELLF